MPAFSIAVSQRPMVLSGTVRTCVTPTEASSDAICEPENILGNMWGALIVYTGLVTAFTGLVLVVHPIRAIRVTSRTQGAAILGAGVVIAAIGFSLPARESRAQRRTTRLDEFMPAWQFREAHDLRIDAPAARVYEAMRNVKADEILLFRALTWIRRGGRPLPAGILNAGKTEPLIDVAIKGGFIKLADDSVHELVLGTLIIAPKPHEPLAPVLFQRPLPPGYALATMNFVIEPDGPNASNVFTETRVFASDASSTRRFARYWRLIYPGSALIRRMWLRAIRRRALNGNAAGG